MMHLIKTSLASAAMAVAIVGMVAGITVLAHADTDDDYEEIVSYIEAVRDQPRWANNRWHIAKWNQVLAALGESTGQPAMAEAEIRRRAAKWPDSHWMKVVEYLDRPQTVEPPPVQAEPQQAPQPVPVSPVVQAEAQAQQVAAVAIPAWLSQDDLDYRSWGAWGDLPDQVQRKVASLPWVHASPVVPPLSLQRSVVILASDGTTTVVQRPALAGATFEGELLQYQLHPNIAKSDSRPWGYHSPRIKFVINDDVTAMNAGISYAYRAQDGSDRDRRSTLDRWYGIDLTDDPAAGFEDDGLEGRVHVSDSGRQFIAGRVVRGRIIGVFSARGAPANTDYSIFGDRPWAEFASDFTSPDVDAGRMSVAPAAYRWHQLDHTTGGGTRKVFAEYRLTGTASFEGAISGAINPASAKSADNPLGLHSPMIKLSVNLADSTMGAGISYASRAQDGTGLDRRSTLDNITGIDVSGPQFSKDGISGGFHGGATSVKGVVERERIIGTFDAGRMGTFSAVKTGSTYVVTE